MRNMIIHIIIIFVLTCCKEKESEQRGELVGNVKNEFGQALEGASVIISSVSEYTATTTSNGQFSFYYIPVDNYQYLISKNGYLSLVGKLSVMVNPTAPVDYILKAGSPVLSISDSIMNISARSGTKSIAINSNSSWIIRNQDDWITTSVNTGTGINTLIINWNENTGDNKRKSIIEFSNGVITKKLLITQGTPLRLLKYTGSDGNPELIDTLFLFFNRPVKVNSLVNQSGTYIQNSQITYMQNSYGFKFQYGNVALGGSYPFTYSVTDSAGDKYSDKITLTLFTRKFDLQGIISDFFISPDNQTIWVSVRNPDKLVLISLKDLKILNEYALTSPPQRITLNVYNDKIYISPGDGYHYIYIPDIYVFDKGEGKIIKTLKIKPHPDDHPNSPSIYPGSIRFTKTGYGIVLSGSNDWSGGNHDVIESSLNDSIYFPLYEWGLDDDDYNLDTNFDFSKIIISYPDGSTTLLVVDGTSHTMTRITPPVNDLLGRIYPSKKANKVFFSAHDKQFILNLDNNQIIGNISYVGLGGFGAFSYKPDEDNYIYMLNDYFRVLDYDNGKTISQFKANYTLTQTCPAGTIEIASTTDGKYLVTVSCSNVYIFDTDMFIEN